MIRTWESHRLSLPICVVSLNLSTVKLQSLAVLLLFRGIMNKEKKTEATEILMKKYNQLWRLPKRAEFTAEELHVVKSVFGPLPRAFEAVGLKKISPMYLEKQKRRAERRRNAKMRGFKNA